MKTLVILLFALSLPVFGATLDPAKSTFNWKGTKVTGEHVGTIKLKSSKLTTDKAKKITGGEFVMDLASVDCTDLKGKWKKKLEDHLKSADFFDVAKHPTAKLTIDKVTDKDFAGKLTIKGKTHPVKVAYTKKGSEYSGTMKFNRTKFDMKYKSGSFFKNLGDKMIHDEVTLNFKVVVK